MRLYFTFFEYVTTFFFCFVLFAFFHACMLVCAGCAGVGLVGARPLEIWKDGRRFFFLLGGEL